MAENEKFHTGTVARAKRKVVIIAHNVRRYKILRGPTFRDSNKQKFALHDGGMGLLT